MEHHTTDETVVADVATDRVGFPGGRARLPRRVEGQEAGATPDQGAGSSPRLRFSSEGFRATDAGPSATGASGDTWQPLDVGDGSTYQASFIDYSPTESLFYDERPEREQRGRGALALYATLGLPPTADWAEIKAAHRRLVAANHPDRFIGAADEDRRAAEDRLIAANLAYQELEREHRGR